MPYQYFSCIKTVFLKQNFTLVLFTLSCICFFTDCSKKSSNPGPEKTNTAIVSTLAGNGAAGSANKVGTEASFNYPAGVAVDASGNVFVADADNQEIRKIDPTGSVSLFAGKSTSAYGFPESGSSNGLGPAASFSDPCSVAVDKSGNVYVADRANSLVRKIDPTGMVSTLAGDMNVGSSDGPGSTASFYGLSGVAVDQSGNVYIADSGNNMIRKVTPDGTVSTIAGNGKPGSDNGKGKLASFNTPNGLAVDISGNIYVADFGNNEIRKITPDGSVTTFAGNLNMGYNDGVGTQASFNHPAAVAVDASGNIYVADDGNELIRKITPLAVVTTIAGSRTIGATNGPGSTASFHFTLGIAVDKEGILYIADANNYEIRKITFQ